MKKYGVIFDMDGVLVDSYEAHYESWKLLAADHGLEFTEHQFAASFGQTSREIIRQYWPSEASEDDVPAWDAAKEAYYREILQADFPAMDGVGDLLHSLQKAGWAMAVGSSGPAENVQVVVDSLPEGIFAATVNGHDVERGKPAPDVFVQAAGKLSLPAERCVVVEDAPVGVAAAHSAGMAAIAITGTATREQLADAELVVDSLRELSPATFAGILQQGRRDGVPQT